MTHTDTTSSSTDSKPTFDEAVELLTGYDEIAIEKKFGDDFDALRFSMKCRALIFIDRKRSGDDDKAAYAFAMGLTVKQFEDHFTPEEDAHETDTSDPETPVGEGDSSAD